MGGVDLGLGSGLMALVKGWRYFDASSVWLNLGLDCAAINPFDPYVRAKPNAAKIY